MFVTNAFTSVAKRPQLFWMVLVPRNLKSRELKSLVMLIGRYFDNET